MLDDYVYEEEEILFSRYKGELERIIRQIKKLPDTEENYHWLQFIKGVLSGSLSAFYDTEEKMKNKALLVCKHLKGFFVLHSFVYLHCTLFVDAVCF